MKYLFLVIAIFSLLLTSCDFSNPKNEESTLFKYIVTIHHENGVIEYNRKIETPFAPEVNSTFIAVCKPGQEVKLPLHEKMFQIINFYEKDTIYSGVFIDSLKAVGVVNNLNQKGFGKYILVKIPGHNDNFAIKDSCSIKQMKILLQKSLMDDLQKRKMK